MMSPLSTSNPISPQGLSGNQITFQISISAMTDQYVALTGRVQPGTYFQALNTEKYYIHIISITCGQ